jgi:hypothetical protein
MAKNINMRILTKEFCKSRILAQEISGTQFMFLAKMLLKRKIREELQKKWKGKYF